MSELSFEQMLEDSVKTIRNGEIVQGTVIDVKEDEIILNIGYKERFQNAGIQANFVRKEGVTLNSTGTQALIPQIAPGEAFALYATVTVPQYMASQELINEVIVTSDETGTQAMTSKANVELKETDNIVTVTPQPASLASQSYGYDSKSGSAYTTASKPRTGDETETALYIVLGIFAIMSGVSAFCYRKTKKQQK